MQNWRNEREDRPGQEGGGRNEGNEQRLRREHEERNERHQRERERGLHFQDDYDLDRARRAPAYGGGHSESRPERDWAPGGTRAVQQ
jgi:hypothetical protein